MLPHVNDSVLLAAAIGLLLVLGLNPFTVPWLLAKMLALLLYIGLGTACLRAPPASRKQAVLFVLAVSAFAYILFTALTKKTVLL